jgi:hypothetical protein
VKKEHSYGYRRGRGGGNPEAEIQSEIIAAQVQALQTKYYETKILKTETGSKCKLCQQYDGQTGLYYISVPRIGKRTMYKRYDRECAELQGNRSKIRKAILP